MTFQEIQNSCDRLKINIGKAIDDFVNQTGAHPSAIYINIDKLPNQYSQTTAYRVRSINIQLEM